MPIKRKEDGRLQVDGHYVPEWMKDLFRATRPVDGNVRKWRVNWNQTYPVTAPMHGFACNEPSTATRHFNFVSDAFMQDAADTLRYIGKMKFSSKIELAMTKTVPKFNSEDDVATEWSERAISKYEYPPNRTATKFNIQMNSQRGQVDWAGFDRGEEKEKTDIWTVVELKAPSISTRKMLTTVKGQLTSYLYHCPNVRFGAIYNGVMFQAYRVVKEPKWQLVEIEDLPKYSEM